MRKVKPVTGRRTNKFTEERGSVKQGFVKVHIVCTNYCKIHHGFQIRWLLFSLCAQKLGLLKDSDEKIGNLQEGDLPNVSSLKFKIIIFRSFNDSMNVSKTLEKNYLT